LPARIGLIHSTPRLVDGSMENLPQFAVHWRLTSTGIVPPTGANALADSSTVGN